MTVSGEFFDLFVFAYVTNSVFTAFLGAGRLKSNFPIDVNMSVRSDLFRFESCIANGTIFISTTFTRTSRRGGDSPFARDVINLFKVFDLEFLSANGTNFMFATLILASGFLCNRPIARSVTERAYESCIVVFSATRTTEHCITTFCTSGRNDLNGIACQMTEFSDLVTSGIVATSTRFVRSPTDFGTSSRLGFVFMDVVTGLCNHGIR